MPLVSTGIGDEPPGRELSVGAERLQPSIHSRIEGARSMKSSSVAGQMATVLYVVAMAAIIVSVDFMFFRNRFWERLTVNIGIVLVFAAFYFRFLKRP